MHKNKVDNPSIDFNLLSHNIPRAIDIDFKKVNTSTFLLVLLTPRLKTIKIITKQT